MVHAEREGNGPPVSVSWLQRLQRREVDDVAGEGVQQAHDKSCHLAHHQHALRRRGGSRDHGVAGELRQMDLDDLPGSDVEQLAARGRGRVLRRRRLRQQDPPARVEAVVDDVLTELTGLLGAAAGHPQLAHRAEPHEVRHVAVPDAVGDGLHRQRRHASPVTPVGDDGDDPKVFVSDDYIYIYIYTQSRNRRQISTSRVVSRRQDETEIANRSDYIARAKDKDGGRESARTISGRVWHGQRAGRCAWTSSRKSPPWSRRARLVAWSPPERGRRPGRRCAATSSRSNPPWSSRARRGSSLGRRRGGGEEEEGGDDCGGCAPAESRREERRSTPACLGQCAYI